MELNDYTTSGYVTYVVKGASKAAGFISSII